MTTTIARTANLAATKQTLVIIDSAIDHHQLLAQGILPTAEVIILDQHQDGITQISALINNCPVASLQIIAHGSPGGLQLGNSQLNLATLYTHRQQLQQWQVAEILIYGCEVAADERGKTFIEQLHQLTRANIAASTKKVGNTQRGGTWELEVNIGHIATTLALRPQVIAAYPGIFPSFATATNFAIGCTGITTYRLAAADFNGDGKQDLVVVNHNGNNVSILLGNGTGGFGSPTNFSVGNAPISVTVADINGDSKLDLIIPNENSNNVSILLGNGIGGFGTATNFTVGNSPQSVAVRDFNGDGKLDLAVANLFSNNVSILLGNGTGGFGTLSNFAVGSLPVSVTVGDFNGDGKPDLAVANYDSDNVSILLGDGSGSFGSATNFTVGTNPYLVTVGDFNGDGKPDLAVANSGSNNVSVLLGNGSGSFGTATNFTVGSSPYSVTVADFNSDGKPDLAVANRNDGNVSVLLGNDSGSFGSATNFTVGSSPYSVTVGDFNGDGKPDLAVANLSNNISVLLNTTPIPPVITLSGDNISYTENAVATLLDAGATVSDIDSANFNTGNLTVRFRGGRRGSRGGTADDRLSIRNQGTGTTEINLDGREVYYGSIKIGEFSGGIGTESLVISLNASATVEATQALLRNITFANTSENPATSDRILEIFLTDDTGNKSTDVTKTVQVIAENDAPNIGNTLVLYDGSTGKKLEEAGAAANAPWFTYQPLTFFGPEPTTSATNNATNLVTNNNDSTYAGYFNYGINGTSLTATPLNPLFPTLDRNTGFVISFGLQVNAQTLTASANKNNDGKTDRAGFSFIVLGEDKKGIELGFLTDRIFAQDDGTTQKNPSLEPDTSGNPNKTLFTQAEGVDFNTTKLVNYNLAILGDQYTLSADGVATLTGKVRDYSAFVPPTIGAFTLPNVYEKPNFLFFGDGTPSAGTNSNLAYVEVTTSGGIPDQTIDQDTSTIAIPFAIADFETAASNLTVTASSSNPDLIPNDGILIGGTDSNRTIKITPAASKFGQATITLNVSDGDKTTSRNFLVNVNGVKKTDIVPIPSRLTNIQDDVFNITGSVDIKVKVKLEITLTERNSNLLNELVLFTVDDTKGTINGIAPGAAGYAQAALERSRVVFSAIANSPNGFNGNNLSSILEVNSTDNLRFLLVKNGTLDAVRSGAISISELLFASATTQKITALGGDEFSVAWQDGSSSSTTEFNSFVVRIKQTNQAVPVGASLQSQSQGEVIDLREVKQAVRAEFSVHREAAYDNFVGFYRVADENGGIDTNGDGVADLLPGQAGYTQAAVRGRVAGIGLAVSNQGTATFTSTFQPGSIFAPFLIVNGRPDALLDTNANNDPAVYFPYLGANADKSDHIRLLGNNIFGFEDLPNGGDKDFNDLIVKVNLTATT
ncbi:MAG: VCBS repeat-containing protein [Goleter apudmare HA4340-LM2]|jgi:hypothetical protein|nr:VCBS repeat-containing protein [Goleter apudmare HA4340-LM2]